MTVRMIGHYPGWRVAVAGAAAMDLTDMYALSDLNVMHRHTITGSSWTEGRAERHSFGVRHRLRVPRLSYYLNYHSPLVRRPARLFNLMPETLTCRFSKS